MRTWRRSGAPRAPRCRGAHGQQHAVFGSFGSDGAALMQADIPAALVAFPARYTHTPFETGHLDDIEALTTWMCALVRKGLGG